MKATIEIHSAEWYFWWSHWLIPNSVHDSFVSTWPDSTQFSARRRMTFKKKTNTIICNTHKCAFDIAILQVFLSICLVYCSLFFLSTYFLDLLLFWIHADTFSTANKNIYRSNNLQHMSDYPYIIQMNLFTQFISQLSDYYVLLRI